MPSEAPENKRAQKERKPAKPERPVDESKRRFLRMAKNLAIGGAAAVVLGGVPVAKGQEAERVAQATTPTTRSGVAASASSSRTGPNPFGFGEGCVTHDGLGATLDLERATTLTEQQFHENIAYMFELTPRYELNSRNSSPAGSIQSITGPSEVFESADWKVEISPRYEGNHYVGSVGIYAKNRSDGGNSEEPISIGMATPARVFVFPALDTDFVKGTILAVVCSTATFFVYFNPKVNKYAASGIHYPNNPIGTPPWLAQNNSSQTLRSEVRIGAEELQNGDVYIELFKIEDLDGNMLKQGKFGVQAGLVVGSSDDGTNPGLVGGFVKR